jgi:transposase-like protein
MANPTGTTTQKPEAELREVVAAYHRHGQSVRATARHYGVHRATMQGWFRRAAALGMIERAPTSETSPDFIAARDRMVAQFQRKQAKGDWRKPVLVTLPPEPFRLKLFGDPHLDNPGCDIPLFIEHMQELGEGVYGVCVGDFFDNWARSLAHLWKDGGSPSDAWTVFEDLMERFGHYMIAACSGNHDDWTHAPVDPIDLVMKRHGVVYRKGAVRLMLAFEGLQPLTVAIRHKWRGGSIYSPAHGIVRAAIWGWKDALMVGGHTHVDEPRMRVHPDGFISHACQVSAFKTYDEYADTAGFIGHRLKPVWDLVIDPRRAETDPDRIKLFWSSAAAASYLAAIS